MYDLMYSMHLERRLYKYDINNFINRTKDNWRFKRLTNHEIQIIYDFLIKYCNYNTIICNDYSYINIVKCANSYRYDLITQGSFLSLINELFYIADNHIEYIEIFDILCEYFGYHVNYMNMNDNNIIEEIFSKNNKDHEYMKNIIDFLLDRGAVINKIELVQKYDEINHTSFESYVYRPEIKDPGYN